MANMMIMNILISEFTLFNYHKFTHLTIFIEIVFLNIFI
jgi:hypothetical protein